MNNLTFHQKAHRLAAQCPWLKWSEVCATLQMRSMARRNYGKTRVAPTLERSAVETPHQHDWQKRADFL